MRANTSSSCRLGPLVLAVVLHPVFGFGGAAVAEEKESGAPAGAVDVEKGETVGAAEKKIPAELRATAMPEMEGSELEKILNRFYREGMGGPESWGRIQSLRFSGELEVEGDRFPIRAYQRKPSRLKMILERSSRELVLATDGDVAWRSAASGGGAREMGPEEGRRFKHNATFGNHLLFPYAQGKTITYVDTVPLDGEVAHHLRIDLDTGYTVDYYVDVRSFHILRSVSEDHRHDVTRTIHYEDYVERKGFPVARKVTSYEDGEWTSTLRIDEIEMNVGAMPWMFTMPGGEGE